MRRQIPKEDPIFQQERRYLLTTERSEVVPFLRVVQGEKEELQSDPAEGSAGATNWGQGSPEFGSFFL